MLLVQFLKWLHVVGATVLLGAGAGIAFFMLMAHRTRDATVIAHVAATVVVADWVFTAPAVVMQPITGALLASAIGWPLTTPWVMISLALYVAVGLFWVPVVHMQARMRDLARAAAAEGTDLPAEYFRLFRAWTACGVPAFTLVLIIIWLMIARPAF
jgi:uncharacterized membrane protein